MQSKTASSRISDECPTDTVSEPVVTLTQALVRLDSSNPDLGAVPGPGEQSIALFIVAWLRQHGIENHWIEYTPGRPSVIGIVRGSGNGKSLMLNGHTDTVTLRGYTGNPLEARIESRNIYGRGSADMKSGLAAALITLLSAKTMDLKGDVILAAVADEESESLGTEDILRAGWTADAAIISEPTEMVIINEHKGFALFDVNIYGLASHGSRPDLGIDAICKAACFLVELDQLASKMQKPVTPGDRPDPGLPSIHIGLIKGGEEISSYPAQCTISIDCRFPASGSAAEFEFQLVEILQRLESSVPDFKFDIHKTFSRSALAATTDDPFLDLVVKHASEAMGESPTVKGEAYWTDMGLLADAGIPGVVWGPKGYGLHSRTEWVEIESLLQLTKAYRSIMADFCA